MNRKELTESERAEMKRRADEAFKPTNPLARYTTSQLKAELQRRKRERNEN